MSYFSQAYSSQNFNDMITTKMSRNGNLIVICYDITSHVALETLAADYQSYVSDGAGNTKAKIQVNLAVPTRQHIL